MCPLLVIVSGNSSGADNEKHSGHCARQGEKELRDLAETLAVIQRRSETWQGVKVKRIRKDMVIAKTPGYRTPQPSNADVADLYYQLRAAHRQWRDRFKPFEQMLGRMPPRCSQR